MESPYRCLLPRREQCRNLLVPVCVSASHVAFASLRMEVQYQMLGAAAGLAASMAARSDRAVHDIPVTALQSELVDDGQVLPAVTDRRRDVRAVALAERKHHRRRHDQRHGREVDERRHG